MRHLAQAVRSPGPRSRGRVRVSPQDIAVGRRLPPVMGSAGAEAGVRTRTVPVRALGWRQQPCGCSPAAAGQLFPKKGQP